MTIRKLVALGSAAALTLTLSACGDDSDSASETIVVGSAAFAENEIIAEIYAQALEAEGITVTKKLNIGAREA